MTEALKKSPEPQQTRGERWRRFVHGATRGAMKLIHWYEEFITLGHTDDHPERQQVVSRREDLRRDQ